MQWLVRDAQPNDALFFHCTFHLWSEPALTTYIRGVDSGHGGQTKDLDGDEDDGYDEGRSFFSSSPDLVVLTRLMQ